MQQPRSFFQRLWHFPANRSEALRQAWTQTRVLTLANMKARYRKTFAGFVWVVINPLVMYGVQSLAFRKILQLNVADYSLFLLSGLLPWIFIIQSLEMCTGMFVNAGTLLKAFPVHPLIFLMSQLLDNMINFLAAFALLLVPVWFSLHGHAAIGLLFLPIPIFLLVVGVAAMCWLLATLNVFYRDTRFVQSFLFSVLFFVTPIFFPASFVPGNLKWIITLNPVYYLISPFRSSIYQFDFGMFVHDAAMAAFVALAAAALATWYWMRKRAYVYFQI